MVSKQELKVMEKVAKKQQGDYLNTHSGVQVPREHGTDTLCLIEELRKIQSIGYKQAGKL